MEDFQTQASWNMNQATCLAIRELLTEASSCSMRSDIKGWYRVLDALHTEATPLIKVTNKENTEKILGKLVVEYNKFTITSKRRRYGVYNTTKLRGLLKEFDLEIRIALKKEGIYMAHSDDPGFAVGGGG